GRRACGNAPRAPRLVAGPPPCGASLFGKPPSNPRPPARGVRQGSPPLIVDGGPEWAHLPTPPRPEIVALPAPPLGLALARPAPSVRPSCAPAPRVAPADRTHSTRAARGAETGPERRRGR